MCLLKQSDRDTNCGHSECKNFYMLNKQMCMYNINQQPQAANTQNVTISAIHPQIQLSSLLSQKPTTFITSQPSLNIKRQANPANESDQETFFLNKKQIKPDVDESKNEDPNQTNFQNNLSDLNILSQQILNQNSGDRNIQQAQFINGINPTNGQICYIKQDNPGMQFGGSAIYIPVVQQGNTNSTQSFTPLVANGQNGFNVVNGAQLFSQNMRIKPTSNNNNILNVNSINLGNIDANTRANNNTNTPSSNSTNTQNSTVPTANGTTAVEVVMKEFQSRISELLLSQNKMLIDLKEKNEVIQDTLACLINEMSSLKSAIKHTPQEKINAGPINSLLLNNIAANSNEVATTETLLHYLYGPNQDFQYQLLMKNPLSLPLYRERNFKFTLLLTDKTGKPIENSNKIPLTVAIYSSESVPKYIDANTAGNKILKGFIDKDMINGTVTFDKIQIKEVTSHFRNGWVFFVVYPKISNVGGNVLGVGRDNVIAAQKIRPFIIEKVIVKAKKAKEKETEEPEEDVFQQEEESETQAQTQFTEENPKQEIPVKA